MANEIEIYIRAGYPAIILKTAEEDRALRLCQETAKLLDKKFAFWRLTTGVQEKLKNYEDMSRGDLNAEIKEMTTQKRDITTEASAVLEEGIKIGSGQGMVYAVLDIHPFIKSPNVWRKAKDLFKIAKVTGITYVFISTEFEVPAELKREVIIASLPLPTRADLSKTFIKMARALGVNSPENTEPYVEAALGLTINEAENAFATSYAKYGRFDVMQINRVKEQTICSGGLLECKSSNETLESIGGLHNFTDWASKRFLAFSPEAKAYGIPAPKGTLLIGVPGSGKSLSAKALANLWQKPLLKLDIGKLFGSLVGETEGNTRKALAMAEAMAPCILWIDEIEKGLAGLQSSGKTDSGVTSRAFGTILTWLQEKEVPVFVIATANNVSQLPPEFLRKGRFDEIFFVDIPSEAERQEIFAIQLKKYKRNPCDFDVGTLANNSENFTGAEIEQAIINALYNTWGSDHKVLTTEAILEAIRDISPMAASGSMSEQINATRRWAEEAYIQKANKTERRDNVAGEARRMIIPVSEEKKGEA